MIWLTDSALKYAANICSELSDYKVLIFVPTQTDIDEIQHKLRTYSKNKHATIHNEAWAWHISFENGSIIKIVYTDDAARGQRCQLAIVSERVSALELETIVLPAEINPRRNTATTTVEEPAAAGEERLQHGGVLDWDTTIDTIPITTTTREYVWTTNTPTNIATTTNTATINLDQMATAVATTTTNTGQWTAYLNHNLRF